MLPSETDVLIVGAGPTGLALANSLQRAGVDHLLVDALEAGLNTSRAGVIHPHTLEMLGLIDMTTPLEAEGTQVTRFVIRDRDQTLLNLDFSKIPSAFQHMLLVPQSTTERVMADRLSDRGGAIHRGIRATVMTADAHGAVVSLDTPQGHRDIRARYVVGADGMHSVVRTAAGIAFEGAAYGESFVLADVWLDWPLPVDEVSLFFSPAGLVVVAPLPDGSFRVVSTMEDAPAEPTVADIQALLDARGPTRNPARVTGLTWSSRFRVHHRLAKTYRNGPFLLMGDAAHVHSPAGGQGMNAGLVDAIVLGEALTRVIKGGEAETVLDDYARTRRPAAEAVLTLASRLTNVATVHAGWKRRLRNMVLRMLNRFPPFKRTLTRQLSGIARRKMSVLPGAAQTPNVTKPRSSIDQAGLKAISHA